MAIASRTVVGADGHEVRRGARGDRDRRQPERRACRVGDGRPGDGRQVVHRHDHQAGGLERARPTDRVERVLEVVGAGRDVDARRPQGGHPGQPAWHRRRAAALEEQVGVGEGDHVDAGLGDELGDRPLLVERELAEAHAMAGRRRVREPGEHAPGELGESARRLVERLVGVEVDRHPELGGELEEEVGRPFARLALEVRAAADEVGAGLERLAEQCPVRGPGGAGHRPAAQRDDLHVDHVGDALLDLEQRLDAAQPVLLRRVGVGADGGEPVGGHQPGRPFGPLDDVGHVEQVPAGLHGEDRAHQVAGRVLDPLGEERLVEVGVGLDGGREQQMAVEVDDDVVGLRRDRGSRPRRSSHLRS